MDEPQRLRSSWGVRFLILRGCSKQLTRMELVIWGLCMRVKPRAINSQQEAHKERCESGYPPPIIDRVKNYPSFRTGASTCLAKMKSNPRSVPPQFPDPRGFSLGSRLYPA